LKICVCALFYMVLRAGRSVRRESVWKIVWNERLTALFNNVRTPKFKAQSTNAFFAAINQMFGGSSQPPTMLSELCSTIWFDNRSLGSSRKQGGGAGHLIDGSEKRICRLSFEFWSPHVIEKRSKEIKAPTSHKSCTEDPGKSRWIVGRMRRLEEWQVESTERYPQPEAWSIERFGFEYSESSGRWRDRKGDRPVERAEGWTLTSRLQRFRPIVEVKTRRSLSAELEA